MTSHRRSLVRSLSAAAVVGLVMIPASAPAVAQSAARSAIAHRQSVLTELSPTGEVGTSRVFTQLTVQGSGEVVVELPGQSTSGLRNLEGFGRPGVEGETVRWSVAATPEGTMRRSVADHTGDHPVTIDVTYQLDGEAVEPDDLVGRSGLLTVTFDIENVTTRTQDVTIYDGQGRPSTESMEVPVPMVASVATTLDSRFLVTEAPGGKIVGDGRGNTVIDWLLVMFSPIGDEQQTFSYTARVSDAVVAPVTATFVPVHAGSFPSLRSSQDAYAAARDGLRDLTNGALIIDSNVKLLGSGAAQLLDGLIQLRDGAAQLDEGLGGTAAPGAQELSAGMSRARAGGRELATGLGDLSSGAVRLSDGLSTARSGGGRLAEGLGALAAGAGDLNVGISGVRGGVGEPGHTAANRTIIGGLNSLRAGIAGLPDSVQAGVATSLQEVLLDLVLPQLQASLETGLSENLSAALQGQVRPPLVAGLEAGLEQNLGAALQGQVRPQLVAGLEQALTAQLQQPPISLPADPAAMVAAGFAGAFDGSVEGAFDAFVEAFVPLFVEGFDGSVAGAFTAFVEAFVPLFVEGFDGSVAGAFTAFVEAFAPQFAAGFGEQVRPRFATLAREFAAGFGASLRSGLAEEALPGFDALLRGLNNPACDIDDPRNPANPCGIRQVLAALDRGSTRLAQGSREARDGSRDLSSGLVQLDDGGRELASGAGRAASGGNDLANGLVQLDDGAGRLAAGLEDAADGAEQIADGLVSAADGGEQIADGTVQLSEAGMGALIEGTTEAATGPSRLLELANAANERGRAGDGLPYDTIPGADASAVFRYELAGLGTGTDEGPSTALQVLIVLAAFGVAAGAGVLLRRRLV